MLTLRLVSFPEVPITGLVLRDIQIEHAQVPLRAMNWESPILSNVSINGQMYPRPTETRVLDVPKAGCAVQADCLYLGGNPDDITYTWYLTDNPCTSLSQTGDNCERFAEGSSAVIPADADRHFLILRAQAPDGEFCDSITYRILPEDASCSNLEWLISRGIAAPDFTIPDRQITRIELARMLYPLCHNCRHSQLPVNDEQIVSDVLAQKRMSSVGGQFHPEGLISRQVMATVAMQSCGVSYKNASTTMPVCSDVSDVLVSLGTNAARALYFGFMELNEEHAFLPNQNVTWQEAVDIMKKVIFFAGF